MKKNKTSAIADVFYLQESNSIFGYTYTLKNNEQNISYRRLWVYW